jgi:hypothetical protein
MKLRPRQMSRKAITRWLVVLTGIGSLMAALDTLVVSTALSTIRLDLDASLEQLEWTVNAYNLSFAIEQREGLERGAHVVVRRVLRRVGAWYTRLEVEQRVQRAGPAPAAGVGEDAAHDADQPAELDPARDVALAPPRDRVGLRDGVVGVLGRHRAGVREHPRIRRAVERFEVHAREVSRTR